MSKHQSTCELVKQVKKTYKKCKKIAIVLVVVLGFVVVITYNLSGNWKALKVSANVVKINANTVIQHFHGNVQPNKNVPKQDRAIKHHRSNRRYWPHSVKSNKSRKEKKRVPNLKTFTDGSQSKNRVFNQHKKRHSMLCGSGWQDKYARLHKNILASNQEEKYLAYSCPGYRWGCCGYGNRLRAVVSLFYLAVLTDRAFLIDWRTPEPIENHLQPKSIQWNYTAPLDICTGLDTRKHYWGTANAEQREAEGWIIKDSAHFRNWFTSTNMDQYLDTPVEEVSTIWYFVEGGIDKNPFLMRRARELDIKPLVSPGPKYALIGCAFDFLFTRSNAVENYLQLWRDKLHKTRRPVIGLHIRTGDHQFDYYASRDDRSDNLNNLTRLNGFFQCARNIEKKVFKNTDKPLWFLATDHEKVKEFARREFPDKIVTTNLTIQHLDILYNTTVLNNTIECNFTTGINGSALCYGITPFNKTLFCANRTNVTITDNSTMSNYTGEFTEGIIAMLLDHFILSESDFLILCDSSFSSTAVGLGMHNTDSFVFGDKKCVDYKRAQTLKKMRFFRKKRSIETLP